MIKTLFIEDDEDQRALLKIVLASSGFEVMEAATPEIGLQLLADERFDLILSDFRLPGITGVELISRLRAQAGPNQGAPAVVLTVGTNDLQQEALKAGVTAVLSKNNLKALGKTLSELVEAQTNAVPSK